MSTKKSLLIIFVLIVGLGLITHWQFLSFKKSLTEIGPPEIKIPEPKLELPSQESKEHKEFISPDGKLKLEYPDNWMEMGQGFLEKFNQEAVQLNEAKILLFVFQFKLEKAALSFLTVQELNLKKVDEIIEGMKKDTEEKGGEMEIVKIETENENAYFEAKYKRENSDSHSKERIIITGESSYLVSVFSPEKDWQATIDEADSILNSIQIVQ